MIMVNNNDNDDDTDSDRTDNTTNNKWTSPLWFFVWFKKIFSVRFGLDSNERNDEIESLNNPKNRERKNTKQKEIFCNHSNQTARKTPRVKRKKEKKDEIFLKFKFNLNKKKLLRIKEKTQQWTKKLRKGEKIFNIFPIHFRFCQKKI